MKQHMVRLDRIASQMNAWLLAIAIGLGMLDLTVMAAKCLPLLPPLPAAADEAAPAPSVSSPPTASAPAADRS